MFTTRRSFIKAGMLAALVTASPLKNSFGQGWKDRDGNPGPGADPQTDPLANYSKSTFETYLNSVFQLQTVGGVVSVTLTQVSDLPAAGNGECFSLLFRGGSRAWPQDTYVLVHPALGTFQLLLVPAGSDQNGAQGYLATINRLSLADFAKSSPPSRQAGGTSRSGASVPAPTQNPSTPSPTPISSPPNPGPAVPAIVPSTPASPTNSPPKVRSKRSKRTSHKSFNRN